MTQEKRLVAADDLYNCQIVSDPQISPNGEHVLFTVQHVDRKTEKKYTNVWLVDTRGGESRQFTVGDQVDRHPRWSPNGQTIAFLSNRKDEKQEQIYLIPLHGGEGRPLTDLKGNFTSFEWSPSGAHLVCQFRKPDAAALEREEDEQKKKLGIVARQITSLDFKYNGAGYLPEEKWHIWTVDVASGEATQLTDGIYNDNEPRWSPDGRQILFLSNRSAEPAKEIFAVDIFLISPDGGEEQKVETRYGHKWAASFSPDGQWIAYLGGEEVDKFYQNENLYIVPTGGGKSRNLSSAYDLNLGMSILTDVGSGSPQTPPIWSKDGNFIYSQTSTPGSQPLYAFPVNGGELQKVISDAGVVGSFSMDAQQNKIAYLWGDLQMIGQVWLKDRQTGETASLTSLNEDLFSELDLGQVEEVWFEGPDNNQLQGWILKPPNFDPQAKYPSILEIHGGPHAMYGHVFMHEFYVLAAQGYVVYWTNPRGSQGYGEAFSGAIWNDWGNKDYADVMAWTDYMAQQPYIDSERMGVTGGSYGGYMTTLIIGRTQRFKAAVAQRVVSNFISFYGSSDINIHTKALLGAEKPPWSDLDNYWRQSPMSAIGGAQTPTMVIHSEQDLRCDREQGEQVFVALQQMGVDSELILFPDESHGLSRIGRTDRRVSRLGHMTRWFEKYLK